VDVSVIVIFEEVYTVLIFFKNFFTIYRSGNKYYLLEIDFATIFDDYGILKVPQE